MKLYEINQQIEALLARMEPDPETGELSFSEEETITQINALALKRETILEYLAKTVLNTKASIQVLKAEERRLRDRWQRLETKQARLIEILDRECGGQKTDLGVATLCYRKRTHVEINDNDAALAWLKKTGHEECYHIPEPEIFKQPIRKLLDAGEQIDGVARVSDITCYLR